MPTFAGGWGHTSIQHWDGIYKIYISYLKTSSQEKIIKIKVTYGERVVPTNLYNFANTPLFTYYCISINKIFQNSEDLVL